MCTSGQGLSPERHLMAFVKNISSYKHYAVVIGFSQDAAFYLAMALARPSVPARHLRQPVGPPDYTHYSGTEG